MQAREGPSSLYGGITVIDPECRAQEWRTFKNLQTPASTGWRVVVPVWPEGVAGEPANFCLQGREKPEAPQGQGWSLPSLDFYMSATLRTEPSCTWGALGVVSGL